MIEQQEWSGENPMFLLCVSRPERVELGGVELGETMPQHQVIDLDEYQWATTHAEWMRRPGYWYLCRKDTKAVLLSLVVEPDDQPYYTARVFGSNKTGDSRVKAYGIGKKFPDGSVMRLWVLENGQVCGGDDVGTLATNLLHGR